MSSRLWLLLLFPLTASGYEYGQMMILSIGYPLGLVGHVNEAADFSNEEAGDWETKRALGYSLGIRMAGYDKKKIGDWCFGFMFGYLFHGTTEASSEKHLSITSENESVSGDYDFKVSAKYFVHEIAGMPTYNFSGKKSGLNFGVGLRYWWVNFRMKMEGLTEQDFDNEGSYGTSYIIWAHLRFTSSLGIEASFTNLTKENPGIYFGITLCDT